MSSGSVFADPKNDYNLNIPRYIDSQEAEDLQDIEGFDQQFRDYIERTVRENHPGIETIGDIGSCLRRW